VFYEERQVCHDRPSGDQNGKRTETIQRWLYRRNADTAGVVIAPAVAAGGSPVCAVSAGGSTHIAAAVRT
jgi:hypothetical protein